MRRRPLLLAAGRPFPFLASLALLAGCTSSPPDDWDDEWDEPFQPSLSQVDVGVGLRTFEDSSWRPTEDLTTFSFDYQDRNRLGPFALEGGIHYAYDRGQVQTLSGRETVETQLWELSAGFRTSLRGRLPFVPYAGFGASLLFADVEITDGATILPEDDVVGGGYAKVGLLFPMKYGSHLSFEARWFQGEELVFDDFSLDPDSLQLSVIFGSAFR